MERDIKEPAGHVDESGIRSGSVSRKERVEARLEARTAEDTGMEAVREDHMVEGTAVDRKDLGRAEDTRVKAEEITEEGTRKGAMERATSGRKGASKIFLQEPTS